MKTASGDFKKAGVWPVMLTPFTDQGEIDLHGLQSLVEFYIENGVQGLFATCLSSEINDLSPADVFLLCKKTIEYADGRVPVAAGVPQSRDLEQIAYYSNQIADTGAVSSVITTCQIAEEQDSDDVWKQRMEQLLDATGSISLGTYECPAPFKRVLSPNLFQWVAQTGRVNFHKDTCCDIEQIRKKIHRAKGSRLNFFNANFETLLDSLRAGGNGFSGVDANFYPELCAWLCENHVTASAEQVRRVEEFINRGLDLYQDTYPRSAKRFLQMREVNMGTVCRREVAPIAEKDQQMLTELYRGYQALSESLGLSKETVR